TIISVHRTNAFNGPVTLTAAGLPSDVTAELPVISGTSGTVVFHAAPKAAHPSAIDVQLTGAASPGLRSVDLGLTVRGAPGSLDVSFGEGGIVLFDFGTSLTLPGRFDSYPDGRMAIVGDAIGTAVTRYTADGARDTGF